MFGDVVWPPNASRRFVSISWASCYLHDAVSAVLATATCLAGWLAGWPGGWLAVCHTPVLYQNG